MEQKNFLFISPDALIADSAWQIQKEGHNVKYYIQNPEEKDIADGFIPKVESWEPEVAWADVIVFDDVLGMGTIAKKLREEGKNVVGGSPYTDKLEDDRAFGQNELKKVGVSIIPQQNFTSFDDAINYVTEHPNKYVIKPSGEAQNRKQLLYVGEEDNGRDVIQVLGHYKNVWSEKIKEFQLQKKITGVEVAVGAFFNGKEFITPINVNFEHKKLFPGNIGPATGEMGTSMFWSQPNTLFNATLAKMGAKLAEENYVGYMDINCIVNNNGVYPLEFTARFGYPSIFIQQESMITPFGQFLY
ncbi:MAG TPA: phosphoribosylamine--glycine ligase, partial [Candidatus Altiarchaeales archaeon]|nr:phosphoribosylamine--glycine ligase [Candidatus Altiarchaeales archaeon]